MHIFRALLALIVLGASPAAFAVDGESIVFNPTTGNYLITHYSDIDGKFEQLTFIPATKINPTINNKLKLEQDGIVHYYYPLTSGRDGQQDILLLILDPVSSVTTAPDIPLNAQAKQTAIDMLNQEGEAAIGKITNIIAQTSTDMDNVAKQFDTPALWDATIGYSDVQNAFRIGWSIKVANGMHPGSEAIFGFKSRDLPGIIQAKIYGYAPDSQKIDGEELPYADDGGFGQQYFALILNDFVRRPTAVPAISVPTPFDPAVTLERIQAHMHTWIAKQLIEPAFSARFDSHFQAAINTYRKQGQAGNGQIGKMLALLVQQYEELEKGDEELVKKKSAVPAQIDKLAALVLYFDLKYVMQRASGGN